MKQKLPTAKEYLILAMIKMLEITDFHNINVKQLCIVAGVNRTTFYAYYDNTFELLQDVKEYMIDKFLENYKEMRDYFESGQLFEDFISEKYLIIYLNYIKDNAKLYKTFLNISFKEEKNDFFEKLISKVSYPVSLNFDKNSQISDVKYFTRFYINGIKGIVDLWMKNNFEEPTEKIAELIIKLKSN